MSVPVRRTSWKSTSPYPRASFLPRRYARSSRSFCKARHCRKKTKPGARCPLDTRSQAATAATRSLPAAALASGAESSRQLAFAPFASTLSPSSSPAKCCDISQVLVHQVSARQTSALPNIELHCVSSSYRFLPILRLRMFCNYRGRIYCYRGGPGRFHSSRTWRRSLFRCHQLHFFAPSQTHPDCSPLSNCARSFLFPAAPPRAVPHHPGRKPFRLSVEYSFETFYGETGSTCPETTPRPVHQQHELRFELTLGGIKQRTKNYGSSSSNTSVRLNGSGVNFPPLAESHQHGQQHRADHRHHCGQNRSAIPAHAMRVHQKTAYYAAAHPEHHVSERSVAVTVDRLAGSPANRRPN